MSITIRKFAPIDRDAPIFEVCIGQDVLFDVTSGVGSSVLITFHQLKVEHTVPLSELLAVVDAAVAKLATEKK